MNFYKKAMMADGGRMPQYGQGGKMPEYAEGGEMEGGAEQLQMLKAAYEKAKDENNEEMVEKIEGVVSDMLASAKSQEAKEMIMEMFPGMGGGEEEEPSMAQGGELKMVKNDDGEMVPFYAADGIGKMMAGGYLGEKKKKKYPGEGYFHMK
jgi:hypothetical protein